MAWLGNCPLETFRFKFSLIVATVGRIEPLVRLLDSLDLQRFRGFEVIVVDQNKPGVIDEILSRFQLRFAIQHLRCATGLSLSRNAGLRHSRGQILAFPDDDCWYAPNGLEDVANLLNAHEEWDGLTVRLADPKNPRCFP